MSRSITETGDGASTSSRWISVPVTGIAGPGGPWAGGSARDGAGSVPDVGSGVDAGAPPAGVTCAIRRAQRIGDHADPSDGFARMRSESGTRLSAATGATPRTTRPTPQARTVIRVTEWACNATTTSADLIMGGRYH